MQQTHVIAQWIGIFFGIAVSIASLVLGILNYLRDSIKIAVSLNLDMKTSGYLVNTYGDCCGMILIFNVGRRPVYISHVYLEVPNEACYLINESIMGKSLVEGDAPLIYPINSESLKELQNSWNTVRAVVEIGKKKFYSDYATKKPSWVLKKDNDAKL